jgi:hypothetical protein
MRSWSHALGAHVAGVALRLVAGDQSGSSRPPSRSREGCGSSRSDLTGQRPGRSTSRPALSAPPAPGARSGPGLLWKASRDDRLELARPGAAVRVCSGTPRLAGELVAAGTSGSGCPAGGATREGHPRPPSWRGAAKRQPVGAGRLSPEAAAIWSYAPSARTMRGRPLPARCQVCRRYAGRPGRWRRRRLAAGSRWRPRARGDSSTKAGRFVPPSGADGRCVGGAGVGSGREPRRSSRRRGARRGRAASEEGRGVDSHGLPSWRSFDAVRSGSMPPRSGGGIRPALDAEPWTGIGRVEEVLEDQRREGCRRCGTRAQVDLGEPGPVLGMRPSE